MKAIEISDLRLEPSPRLPNMTRLSVAVAYPERWSRPERIWFEIPAELGTQADTGGDSWAVSVLPLAVTLGYPLSINLPVDSHLQANLQALMRTWSDWYPELELAPLHTGGSPDSRGAEPTKTGAFFSGGIDSFYTVLRAGQVSDEAIDDLIFVHGFDVSLDNHQAYDRVVHRLEAIASALEKNLVIVATNLRETRFNEASWTDIAFGCLLAGAGLALENRYRRLIIASGLPAHQLRPHASHPETDPFFSTSRTVFRHYEPEADRIPKLEFLRDYPLALDNIRVCYESPTGDNCGRCLKCVIAMAMLEIIGEYGNSAAFPGESLDLDRIRHTYISQGVISFRTIQEAAVAHGRQDIAEAVEDAFRRTERFDRWFRLGWIRRVRGRFQGHPLARRITRWFRPLVWGLGRALNRFIP